MDFAFSPEQQASADLCRQILTDRASHERQREIERGDGPRHDPALWRVLAEAGLLGLGVPEAQGGAGLGIEEVGAVLEELGRAAAPVPGLATLALAVPALVEFGSSEAVEHLLAGVVRGDVVLTAALMDHQAPLGTPTTTATVAGAGFRLDGRKVCVPAAAIADRILVSAAVADGGTIVAVVDPAAAGVEVLPLVTTAGSPDAAVHLSDVAVDADAVLGGERRADVLSWMLDRATALQCLVMAGVCDAALRLTATYVTERKQFDVPIATFQAVGQRAADAYVDTEAIRLTAWQAVWRLAHGMDAALEVEAAKFWAAEAGQRVVHAGVHLHGGVGVDRDYPLSRLFLTAKELELQLGGTTDRLRRLGRLIAARA